jgi:lanosterol synthase
MAREKAGYTAAATGGLDAPSEKVVMAKRTTHLKKVNQAGAQPKVREHIDKLRWRMRDDQSRHTWHYLEGDEAAKQWPQSYADKYYLGLPLVSQLDALPLIVVSFN